MLKHPSRLATCEQHISNIQHRIEQLNAAPDAGSGFLSPTEMLISMQQTLDRWRAYRDELMAHERTGGPLEPGERHGSH